MGREDYVKANFPVLWLFQAFCPSLVIFPDGVVGVSGIARHSMVSCFLHCDQEWGVCGGLYLLQREASLMRGERHTELWV